MIEPTERALWLIAAAAAFGALGFGIPALGDAAAFALAGIFGLGLLDFFLAGSPRGIRIERTLPELVVEGRPAELSLLLTSPRRALLDVVHSLPADALAAGEDPDCLLYTSRCV